jgi:hypothetical protein
MMRFHIAIGVAARYQFSLNQTPLASSAWSTLQ